MPKVPHLSSQSLCDTFTAAAKKIWDDLKVTRGMAIIRDEEQVTGDLLKDVQIAHPTDVATFQFYKPEEKHTGADWEWWLTDGRQWLGLLIQAKILNKRSNTYTSIKHRVGKAKVPQIDLLLNQARLKGIDALYFFYNYTPTPLAKLCWNCQSMKPTLEQFGCIIADASVVKKSIGRGAAGIPTIGPISWPLRCLVCCNGFIGLQNASLPQRTYSVVKAIRELANGDAVLEPEKGGQSSLRDAPPLYVQRLLAVSLEDRNRVMEELRAEIGPIGSLVVTRESR